MEQLLHYVWKHKIFPLKELKTTTGQQVEVIDTGLANTDAGPDFFNAKLKLDGVLWIGNIEIHERSSDWFKHGHHADAGYNSVILHIASEIDTEISRSNGERIPQIQLICPEAVRTNYKELLETDSYPPCYRIIPSLPPFTAHSWMTALQMERFEQKATLLNERLKRCQGNWEDAFFITLARNFGFGLNGDAFETWAHRLPFRAVDKHRNDLFQIEAIFFGQAGILEDWNFPIEIPAGNLELPLIKRLCEINPTMQLPQSDPTSYDNNPTLIRNIIKNKQRTFCDKVESRGIVYQLIARFLKDAKPKVEVNDNRIQKVLSHIRKNIYKTVDIDSLAAISCLSKDHFIRLFKKEVGTTPLQYINQKKIEKAQLILITEDIPVKNIAYLLAYEDHSYFNRLFKKITDVTPQQYRELYKK